MYNTKEFGLENFHVGFLEYNFADRFDGLIGNNILVNLDVNISYKDRVISTEKSIIKLFFNREEEVYYSRSMNEPIHLSCQETNVFHNRLQFRDVMQYNGQTI